MTPTYDALIFGLAYLNGPRATLSFGGDGAKMAITPRARVALNCLINCGFAEKSDPTDQINGREYFRGLSKDLGLLAKERGLDPFSMDNRWTTFEKIGGAA